MYGAKGVREWPPQINRCSSAYVLSLPDTAARKGTPYNVLHSSIVVAHHSHPQWCGVICSTTLTLVAVQLLAADDNCYQYLRNVFPCDLWL